MNPIRPCDIHKIASKEEAFTLIDAQTEWNSRKKAAIKYQWKQKHDMESIQRCPAKGKRYRDTLSTFPPDTTVTTKEEWWRWVFDFEQEYNGVKDLERFRDFWTYRLRECDEAWVNNVEGYKKDYFMFFPSQTALHSLCSALLNLTYIGETRLDSLVTDLCEALGDDALLRDDWGCTPFHDACQKGRLNHVRLFVEKFADRVLNTRNNDGETGFIIACKHGSVEVAQFLYNRGANIHLKDVSGRTGLDWAREDEHTEVVEFFEERM